MITISKSQLKKNRKKTEKVKLRLSEKYGLKFSSEPTEIIVIANAGLANDVKRRELKSHLSTFNNQIKDIITSSQLTFAVVICNDRQSSRIVFDQIEFFTILTPDLPSRQSVNAFCLYSENLPADIESEIVNFHPNPPAGLIIIDDFLTIAEERELFDHFQSFSCDNSLKNRSVIHFGFEFHYDSNLADYREPLIDKPIPKLGRELLEKLERQIGRPYSQFNQLTVNVYGPGQGIPSHTDTHSVFSDEIVSISLNSAVVIEWTRPDTPDRSVIDLPARSACLMTGESRYLWRHAIPARKSDLVFVPSENRFEKRSRSIRMSLTFRRVKPHRECRCQWPESCDMPRTADVNQPAFQPERPERLELEYVHRVYDDIADHFSSTRHSMWPKVRRFIDSQSPGSIGADVGCGNGKYFPAIIDRGFLLGSDSSVNLCRIAATRLPGSQGAVVKGNCLQLPYRDACCDYVVCIAVLHHLSTNERRRRGIEEMRRVLVKGGRGLVYVWAIEQQKGGEKSNYLTKELKVECERNDEATELPIHQNGTEFRSSDMLVPWCRKTEGESDKTVYNRYYHLFREHELEELCEQVPGISVIDRWYDSGNWVVVFKKL